MYPRIPAFEYGFNSTHTELQHRTKPAHYPQWVLVTGKVGSYMNSGDIFHGNEVLEVSVVNASLMDAPSVLLGRQKILLQPGQRFPIRFQFYYDKSKAGPGYGGRMMQATIKNMDGQLLYINDTQTPLKYNVNIDVKHV